MGYVGLVTTWRFDRLERRMINTTSLSDSTDRWTPGAVGSAGTLTLHGHWDENMAFIPWGQLFNWTITFPLRDGYITPATMAFRGAVASSNVGGGLDELQEYAIEVQIDDAITHTAGW